MQDNWHHWEDVSVGFLLGLGIAYAFYRQHYHGIASTRAGEAFLPILDPQNGDETAQQRQRYNDIEAANFGDDLDLERAAVKSDDRLEHRLRPSIEPAAIGFGLMPQ